MDGSDNDKVGLKKSLKVQNCVSLIIGVIIGSGIFIAPKGVVQETGSVGTSLIIWVLGGIFSIFGAMSYSELGCMIPKAGGEYEYLTAAFGELVAFLFIWTFLVIMIPATFALSALTFADYALQPFYPTCTPPIEARLCLAAVSIILITALNCVSIKGSNLAQHAFNAGKIVGLLLIIGIGIYCLILGRYENFTSPFENSATNPGKYAIAIYSGLYCYSGWSFLNYVVEEIQNPNKTLPISIFIGLGIVIIIYAFANVAYFTLLSPREMIESSAVAFTFSEKLLGPFSWIMSIFVSLSSIGYINGGLFSSSRTIYSAARKGHMPTVLALLSVKSSTPITSLMFLGFLSLLCIFFEDVFILLRFAMLAEYIFIGGTIAGLLWLRKTQPDLERPIKVSLFFPIAFLCAASFIILMTLIMSPNDSLICVLIILAGIPIYYIFVKAKKPKSIQRKIENFTIFVQKLTLSAFGDEKSE